MAKKNQKGKLKSFLKRRSLVLLFFTLSLSFIIFNVFYKKTPLMIIDAQSRSIKYTVLNSDAGKILFQAPVYVKQSIKGNNQCMVGLFEPEENTVVSYYMFENALIIRANNEDKKHSAYFVPKDKPHQKLALTNQSSLSYGSQTKCHPSPPPLRLPVWGKAEIGQTPIAPTLTGKIDPFAGLLMGGQVTLFGKNVFGDGLYPAGKFSLPVGARLSSNNAYKESAAWWGYAIYIENTDKSLVPSLSLSASTESTSLNLNRLASGSKTETIEASFLTQLTNDPFIASIGIILAGMFFLSEFILALQKLWRNNED